LQGALLEAFDRVREAAHAYLQLQINLSLALAESATPDERDSREGIIYRDSEAWLRRPPEEAVLAVRIEDQEDDPDERDRVVEEKVDAILAELRRTQGDDFLPMPPSWFTRTTSEESD
jgi:hypothetical protein